MKPARINYAILSSHRSGSTLLCTLLSQTDIIGKPGEYFSHWNDCSHKDYDITNYPEYIQGVVDDTQTSNGVFGMKMMAGVDGFQGILNRLETFPEYNHLSNPEKIRTFFPNIKFIYLTRRNKVAQAISWWKAVQNNHYHSFEDIAAPDMELEYNFEAITHLFKEATIEECAHQALLESMDAIPLTIVYEDYIQDMPGTIERVKNFLEIEGDYSYETPSLVKMADALTDEWAERYRIELQADWQNKRW